MNRLNTVIAMLILLSAIGGCRQPVANPPSQQGLFGLGGNPYANSGANNIPNLDIQMGTPEQNAVNASLSSQINNMNQRMGAFDSDNQQLHSELASLKQRLQLSMDYNQQLKQQLADTAGQFQQLQVAKMSTDQRLAASQFQLQQVSQNQSKSAPTQLAGTATIRANNSLMQKLQQIQIPGGDVRMDGDVIRIEFPSNVLFVQGSYQIQASQVATLQNLIAIIRRDFPKQIIGIEAHWDGTPLSPPGTTDHQLTATQALAILTELKRLGLPERQMFSMSQGSNRARHPANAPGSPNRRIEIVIYPEEF